ncbi:MAG: hypothetical protein QGG64_05930, partial [Candidatus Latescibacteria bacterium]|nr:hypothetical protein [Candidatus Latescibacterota bacterium]
FGDQVDHSYSVPFMDFLILSASSVISTNGLAGSLSACNVISTGRLMIYFSVASFCERLAKLF